MKIEMHRYASGREWACLVFWSDLNSRQFSSAAFVVLIKILQTQFHLNECIICKTFHGTQIPLNACCIQKPNAIKERNREEKNSIILLNKDQTVSSIIHVQCAEFGK